MFLMKKNKIEIQLLLTKTSKDLKRKNQRKTRRIRRTRIKKRSKKRLKQVKIAKQMILMSSSQFTRSNKCGLPTRLTAQMTLEALQLQRIILHNYAKISTKTTENKLKLR